MVNSNIKFMTFNIRHDKEGQKQPFQAPPSFSPNEKLTGEQPWSIRKWKIADTILFYQPDIIGFQVNNIIFI